jgi:hypothetical protein
MNQAEIESYNTRELWVDTLRNLSAARHELELAQGNLEDLGVPHISENLSPLIESVERFLNLAADKVEA